MTSNAGYNAGKVYLDNEAFNGIVRELREIPTELLDPGKFQTRKNFDRGSMQELVASIGAAGTNFEAIIVRRKPNGRYEIIAGERRVRACIMAGVPKVSSIIGDYNDEQSLVICVTENLQRQNLNPIEEAEGFKLMVELKEISHKQVAEIVGKSRPYITNSIRLLNLDLLVRDYLIAGKLSAGHGKAFASVDSKAMQRDLCFKCVRGEWSVRTLETKIRALLFPKSELDPPDSIDRGIARLEEYISTAISHPCRIKFNKTTGGGVVGFEFFGTSDFNALMDRVAPGVDLDTYSSEDEDEDT